MIAQQAPRISRGRLGGNEWLLPMPDSPDQLTLREAWHQFVRRHNVTRAPATLAGHRGALSRWEEFCARSSWPEPSGTLDPLNESPPASQNATSAPRTPSSVTTWGAKSQVSAAGESGVADTLASAADPDVAQRFICWLLARPVGPARCRTYWSTVALVLKKAAARGIIARVPDVELPRVPRSRPQGATAEQLTALIDAAHATATWPVLLLSAPPEAPQTAPGTTPPLAAIASDGWDHARLAIPPGYVWETWLLLFWTYGARTQDFVGYSDRKHLGLEWSEVEPDPACPDHEDLANPHGWLDWLPDKTGAATGERLLLPLHPLIGDRLAWFRGLHRRRVFPNSRTKGCRRRGWRGFLQQWDLIARQAGVSELTVAGSGRRPSLRKACAQNWDRLSKHTSPWILGHGRQCVTSRYYLDRLDEIVGLLPHLPMPEIRPWRNAD